MCWDALKLRFREAAISTTFVNTCYFHFQRETPRAFSTGPSGRGQSGFFGLRFYQLLPIRNHFVVSPELKPSATLNPVFKCPFAKPAKKELVFREPGFHLQLKGTTISLWFLKGWVPFGLFPKGGGLVRGPSQWALHFRPVSTSRRL